MLICNFLCSHDSEIYEKFKTEMKEMKVHLIFP